MTASFRIMSEPARIHVAVVEERRTAGDSLAALIGGAPGFRCVARWTSLQEALAKLRAPLPRVLVCDTGCPGTQGIETLKALGELHPGLLILVLSDCRDDREICDALCAGVTGCVSRSCPPEVLLESLRLAVAGGAPMSREIALRVVSLFRRAGAPATDAYRLTPHEVRMLHMVASGHHYKTAAAALGVTATTVSFHLQQIYKKLHVHSKAEAVAKALREGLVR